MKMYNILIIKLVTGDELITNLEKDEKENFTILNKPFGLLRPHGHIELHPEWLAGDGNNPHTFVKVRTDAIIAEVDPPETLIKRYKNLLDIE